MRPPGPRTASVRRDGRRGIAPPLVGVCARPAPLSAGLAAWLSAPPLCAAVAETGEPEVPELLAMGPRLIVATREAALRSVLPAARDGAAAVLVLTDDPRPEHEAALMAAGADGVADIDAGRARFLRTVRDALEGRPLASRAAVRVLAARRRGEVTPRQHEILSLLADGRSTAEVADALCIAPSTVKTHVARIGQRLGVPGRRALAHAAPALLGESRVALAEAAAGREEASC